MAKEETRAHGSRSGTSGEVSGKDPGPADAADGSLDKQAAGNTTCDTNLAAKTSHFY